MRSAAKIHHEDLVAYRTEGTPFGKRRLEHSDEDDDRLAVIEFNKLLSRLMDDGLRKLGEQFRDAAVTVFLAESEGEAQIRIDQASSLHTLFQRRLGERLRSLY